MQFIHMLFFNNYYTWIILIQFDDHWVSQFDRAEDHMDLADRLVECQYELTDRLAFYLCQRKPGKNK